MSHTTSVDFSFFSKNGYLIFDVEDLSALQTFQATISESVGVSSLPNLHHSVGPSDINDRRIAAFREINRINEWEQLYFSLARTRLKNLLGPDIAIQSKLNLSIQMPHDESSILSLHTDALSGQSVFELVLWLPLTDSFDSNSMYIFSPSKTYEMLAQMPNAETKGMNHLFELYRSSATFLNVKYGQALIFTPTMFHGNTLNTTQSSRLSINCRFKNLFSNESDSGERRLGSFYRILEISPLTEFGLAYRDDYLSFS